LSPVEKNASTTLWSEFPDKRKDKNAVSMKIERAIRINPIDRINLLSLRKDKLNPLTRLSAFLKELDL
jgi:hypothetical protein